MAVVELKAIAELPEVTFVVVRSYVRATNEAIGLILNFPRPVLQIKCI